MPAANAAALAARAGDTLGADGATSAAAIKMALALPGRATGTGAHTLPRSIPTDEGYAQYGARSRRVRATPSTALSTGEGDAQYGAREDAEAMTRVKARVEMARRSTRRKLLSRHSGEAELHHSFPLGTALGTMADEPLAAVQVVPRATVHKPTPPPRQRRQTMAVPVVVPTPPPRKRREQHGRPPVFAPSLPSLPL
jgi:hypothetical protein